MRIAPYLALLAFALSPVYGEDKKNDSDSSSNLTPTAERPPVWRTQRSQAGFPNGTENSFPPPNGDYGRFSAGSGIFPARKASKVAGSVIRGVFKLHISISILLIFSVLSPLRFPFALA